MKTFNYIVVIFSILCFVACRSVSSEISESFKRVDESITRSNKYSDQGIDQMYSAIQTRRHENLSEASRADTAYISAKTVVNYLTRLKDTLKSLDSAGTRDDIAGKIILQTVAGDSLIINLGNFYRTVVKASNVTDLPTLDSCLNAIKDSQTNQEWKKNWFEHTPTIGAITILNKFQNDCLQATLILLQDIKRRQK